MGVEPTLDTAEAPSYGFEVRGAHRDSSAPLRRTPSYRSATNPVKRGGGGGGICLAFLLPAILRAYEPNGAEETRPVTDSSSSLLSEPE